MGEQSGYNKYKSKYSPDSYVRPDQYLAEIMCERRAKSLSRKLPMKFWVLPEWKNYYFSQLKKAQSLLKKYHHSVIVKSLQDKNANFVYSLGFPGLERVLQRYNKEKELIDQSEKTPKKISSGDNHKRKKFNSKPSLFDRLDEIDGEEKTPKNSEN